MRLYMSFHKPRAYGKCSVFVNRLTKEIVRESITVYLKAFTNGLHKNQGKRHLIKARLNPNNMSDENMIEDISYTINHEFIHLISNRAYRQNHKQGEYIVYYMINNGGNNYFHDFFKIKKDLNWWPNA